jgi:DNA-binding response OmpR family regulator
MNPKRILIIDDDKGLTQMVKLNLQATGHYEVCIENCSTHAVETARRFHPDLILLDYVMPGLDGGDVTLRLQEDPLLSSVPIIMVSALVSNAEASPDGTVSCGGQVMLAKPVTMRNLLKCIERHLPIAT